MCHIMKNPAFCMCNQCLVFCYIDSTISLLSKSEIPQIFLCGSTALFTLDLVGNPDDRFSRNAAHITPVEQIAGRIENKCHISRENLYIDADSFFSSYYIQFNLITRYNADFDITQPCLDSQMLIFLCFYCK